MRKNVAFALVAGTLLLLVACGGGSPEPTPEPAETQAQAAPPPPPANTTPGGGMKVTAKTVEPSDLEAVMASGNAPLLVDVRMPNEFAEAHVPGARNVPLPDLKARLGELEEGRTNGVIVYCRSGRRAASAAAVLRSEGFTDVSALDGHMEGWLADKRPVETGSGS